ncbi:uncharacterized protein LOC144149774 [Haemaphysalis longicornis]
MSNLHKAVSDMIEEKGEMGYPEVLKALGLNMLKVVEMSAQEAAWFLLRQDISEKSRAVIYIPTCFPEERVRVRKTNKELEHLPPSSTDVWRENVIDEYQRRPEELKDVSLAEFVSAYTKNREGQYQLRRTECVIRYRHYSQDDALNYQREQVLLHVPFRNEDLEVLDNNAFVKTYTEKMTDITKLHAKYIYDSDCDSLMELARGIAEAHRVPSTHETQWTRIRIEPGDEDVMGHDVVNKVLAEQSACAAVRKRDDIMDTEKFYDLMRLTNSEQHEFLRELIHRQTTPGAEPLRAFFTGPAGCGKTFILKLAMDIYNRFNPDPPYNSFVICASTEKAAVAVGGTTMHSAFKLSRSRTNDGGLRDSELNTFRMAFRNVRCVIIDEISMMSADQLDAVDMRLRHVTQKYNEPFGGVDMILCGDLRQLPPVRASEIYKRTRGSNRVFASEVKWHTMSYFPLVRVVRPKDARFSGILTKIGNGVPLDPQELSLIESRFVTAEDDTRLAPDAVRLYYLNDSVNKYNV